MKLGKLIGDAVRHALGRGAGADADDLAALEARLAGALERGGSDDARSICARILDAAPDHPGARWAMAVLLLQAGEFAAAVRHFARFDAGQSGGRVTTRGYRSAVMDSGRHERGEPYVGWRENVLLETNHCAIFDGEDVYFRETQDRTFANHPWVRGRVAPDGGDFVVSLPPVDRAHGFWSLSMYDDAADPRQRLQAAERRTAASGEADTQVAQLLELSDKDRSRISIGWRARHPRSDLPTFSASLANLNVSVFAVSTVCRRAGMSA